MRPFIHGALAAGTVVSIGFVMYAADVSSPWMIPLAAVFALWAVSPYAVVFGVSRAVPSRTGADAVLLLTGVALGAFALWAYYLGFVAQPDPQSGLLFLFVPAMQWAGAAAGLVVAAIWAAVDRRHP